MYKGMLLAHIFLMLFGLAVNAEAANQGHQHHDIAVTDTVCEQVDVLPSLRCANAPSAIFDDKGRLWVAWVFGDHVYVNYSDDKGKTYSPPVVVNSIPEHIYARGENRPKIVIGNNQQVYVSWTQKLAKRFSGYIRFSRSIDGGKTFFDPITVNDHRIITSHRFDSMVVNKRGDIYLAWLDKRDLLAAEKADRGYNGAALYYALSADNGKTFSTNIKIIDNTCQCCRVAMEIDTDQLPVILWRHIFGNNIRDHALVKFDSRIKAGEIFRVSNDQWQIDACPHHGPDISISDNGSYHLVWFNNAPERHGLFYARTNDQGKNITTPLSFGNYQAQAAHPQVLSLNDRVYLVWKEFDGKQSMLYMMKSSDSGNKWSEPHLIAKTSGSSDHPLLIRDGVHAYVVWHRRGQYYKLFQLEDD